jgi:hypothetical protein
MASTYVNDLRLNEMATGDGSGTWGTTTNTNLELIAEAFSYGTEAITTNADTHTTTIADGATDPGRALYLKYTGTLDSACTITIGPNTVSKVWIVENGTSGSQNIILSQGSGANITIPAGDTKVVYSDGAGAGAAFVDAFASLSVVDLKVQDALTVGGTTTLTGAVAVTPSSGTASIAFTSGGAGSEVFSINGQIPGVSNTGFAIRNVTDSRNDLTIDANGVIAAASLDISGDIDVDGTTNLDVVDIDGAVNMATTALVTGVLTTTATQVATGGITSGSDIISDTDSTDSLGSTGVRWLKGWFDTLTAGTLTVGSGSVTDSSGAISFGDENLTTTGIVTAAGTSVFTNLDISGDIDVDGTTNLDVVDIDGAVDMASTALVTGVLTANGGAVFNEAGADVDFRVESDTVDHALFVQGSDGFVGIGTSSPDAPLSFGANIPSDGQTIHTYQSGNTRSGLGIVSSVHRMFTDTDSALSFGQVSTTDGSTYTERLRITSTGNVGIGTSSPTTFLDIDSGLTSPIIRLTSSAEGQIPFKIVAGIPAISNSGFSIVDETASANRLVIDSSGYVGIGTGSPGSFFGDNYLVAGNGTGTPTLTIYGSTSGTSYLLFADGAGGADAYRGGLEYSHTSNFLNFFSDGASRMRIDSSGNLLVGKTELVATTAGHVFYPSGEANHTLASGPALKMYRTGSDGQIAVFHKTSTEVGSISVTASATTYNTSSDYRLKEDDVPMTGATERVKALRPINFAWKVDGSRVDGFLAHEVQEIVPEAITGTKDAMRDEEYEVTPAVLDDDGNVVTEAVMGTREVPEYQGIDQSKLVPLLTKAIQEQQTLIESLTARITTLEG